MLRASATARNVTVTIPAGTGAPDWFVNVTGTATLPPSSSGRGVFSVWAASPWQLAHVSCVTDIHSAMWVNCTDAYRCSTRTRATYVTAGTSAARTSFAVIDAAACWNVKEPVRPTGSMAIEKSPSGDALADPPALWSAQPDQQLY